MRKKCRLCGRWFTSKVGEPICDNCAEAVEEDAAADMGCEDYYAMTGKLPGDK